MCERKTAIWRSLGVLATGVFASSATAADIESGSESTIRFLLESQSSYVALTGNALNRGGADELEDDSFSTSAGTARVNLDLGNGLNIQGDVFGEYAWVNSGSDTTYKSAFGGGLHGYMRGETGAIGVFGALADINFDEDDPGNAPGGPAHVFGLEGLWFGEQFTIGAQVGLMDSDRSKDEDMIRDAYFVRGIARHYFAESTLIQAEASFAKGEMDNNVGEEVEIFSVGARIQHELDFVPGDFNWPGKVYVAYRGDFAEQSDPFDANDNKSLNSHTILVGTTFTFGHSLMDNERNGAAFDLPSFVRWNGMAGGPIE